MTNEIKKFDIKAAKNNGQVQSQINGFFIELDKKQKQIDELGKRNKEVKDDFKLQQDQFVTYKNTVKMEMEKRLTLITKELKILSQENFKSMVAFGDV
jgi:Tfp pilus assembly protein PilO